MQPWGKDWEMRRLPLGRAKDSEVLRKGLLDPACTATDPKPWLSENLGINDCLQG